MFYVLDINNIIKFKKNKKHNKDCKCYFETTDLRKTISSLINRYYDIPEDESMTWELMYNVLSLGGFRTLATDYGIEIYTSENEMLNRLAEIALYEER